MTISKKYGTALEIFHRMRFHSQVYSDSLTFRKAYYYDVKSAEQTDTRGLHFAHRFWRQEYLMSRLYFPVAGVSELQD